jgi:AP-1 complex subunit sigma 1/2
MVYRRYASLFFAFALHSDANVLLALDLIHRLVETLDKYFGAVCELDLVFQFHKSAYLIDEMFVGGVVAETSAKAVLEGVQGADEQETVEKEEALRAITPRVFQ